LVIIQLPFSLILLGKPSETGRYAFSFCDLQKTPSNIFSASISITFAYLFPTQTNVSWLVTWTNRKGRMATLRKSHPKQDLVIII
jgi:hypothetical protein